MLLSPELLLPMGPPPQAVLDQRWLWNIMLFLLGMTFTLRLIGLDIAGALLSGLMLCFGVIMTRDGMQEMPKYALVYAVLCGLNFFFDILPLITELGGRISRVALPADSSVDDKGYRSTTFTMTTRITPFFDPSQGLIYNVQSMAMVLSPLTMALGVYLAISAHNEIQRLTMPFWEADLEDFGRAFPQQQATATMNAGATAARNRAMGASSIPPRQSTSPGAGASTASSTGGRESYERFTGVAHKLSDD